MKPKIWFSIRNASDSGGKAGKGRNKTTTLQVFECARRPDDSLWRQMVKAFRYKVDEPASYAKAMQKALAWVEERKIALARENDPSWWSHTV